MELKERQESSKRSQDKFKNISGGDELFTIDKRDGELDSFLPVDLHQPHDLSKQNGDCPQDTAASDNKSFENIFHVIGHNGRFQILMVAMFIITNANVDLQNLNTVFTLTTPEHRCKLPGLEQDSYDIRTYDQAQLVDLYIPKVKDGGYRKCHVLSGVNNTKGITEDSLLDHGSNLTKCSDWVYDKTVMKQNLVSKLNLVCDRIVYRSHGNMVLFGGKMAAGFLQGHFSIEFMTTQQRSLLSIFTRVIFGLSDLYMALMAYVLRDWQYLLLSIAWPAVFAVVLCWFMPESPRWLISKNKIEKAEQEIQRIAKMNRRSVPHGITRHLRKPDEKSKHTVLQLFAERRLIVRWTILYLNWVLICLSTYGLVFNISNMGGNIFLNFAVGGLLDAVVSVLNSFIVNRFSRKYFYFFCSAFGACACILTILPTIFDAPKWCVVALSLIGKAALVAAYPILYTYSAELFPTTHRGIGVGSCSMMSRIGGLISPYIADLGFLVSGKMASVLPQIVLGSSAMLGSLLILILPETRGRDLPETIDDIRGVPQKNKQSSTPINEKAVA
ncbi:organic cation transporter protein [Elysia marginata]|uniref:Organic cation transporter protein n=1 Tax=Elysia marginata TaxID=1093978 RepID=A0AAV4F0G4_9GAST|nr:organic cation transporter protein [Elysia marginata]